MFDNFVYDPIHVVQYHHEYEAYRVKVMARALLQEAEKCVWAEKAILLCVKALQWLHVNAALFMGPVLEREFEQMRQWVHRIVRPLNVSLETLENVLWRRVSRTRVNWAAPHRLDRAADLWVILKHITSAVPSLSAVNATVEDTLCHALFAMLCVDWLLHNPHLFDTNAKLCDVLRAAITQDPVLADMYGRQMAQINLPVS